MASNAPASAALFVAFNLLFFALVGSCGVCPGPTPKPPSPSFTPPSPSFTPPGLTPPSPGIMPPSPGSSTGRCPMDTLKLAVCANVLNGLINLNLGKPPKKPCCTLIQGLADLEAAVCLCTVLKANILGIRLNLPINLSLLVNYCGKRVPTGFQCP